MTAFDAYGIRTLCQGAGFVGNKADIMAAIAYKESSGDSNAANESAIESSYGLFQINRLAHPNIPYSDCIDPHKSAIRAYDLSNGGNNFLPWTMYKNGQYLQLLTAEKVLRSGLPRVTSQPTDGSTPQPGPPPTADPNAPTSDDALLQLLGIPSWADLQNGTVNALALLASVILFAVGVNALVQKSPTAKGAIRTVKGGVKLATKVAKVAAIA